MVCVSSRVVKCNSVDAVVCMLLVMKCPVRDKLLVNPVFYSSGTQHAQIPPHPTVTRRNVGCRQ